MVHIVDGVLSAPVLITGAIATAAAVAWGLKTLTPEDLPRVGLISSALFVGTLVHVPLGPSNVHLLLNGLAGLVLGWAAFPAILVALLLQAVFFGYGGVTVLGVNTMVTALPAVLCHYAFRSASGRTAPFAWGAAAGAAAIVLTSVGVGVALAASGREFLPAAKLVVVAHVPVMMVEAVLTGAVVVLLHKVKPEALAGGRPMAAIRGG